MALGTIASDTIQDGAGNSTATTTVIKGSAKAWVNFTDISGTVVIIKSFNCSSVVRNAAGYFTFNFTTAMTDTGYVPTGTAGGTAATNSGAVSAFQNPSTGAVVAPTTSAFVFTSYNTGGAPFDPTYVNIAVLGN